MTLVVELKDRNGLDVEIGQRVALKVHRRGGFGNWWQMKNKEHFTFFWLPGEFRLVRGDHSAEIATIAFSPDRESEKALEQPMGKEREEQTVDHLNVDILNPENIDTVHVPPPGTFMRCEPADAGKEDVGE